MASSGGLRNATTPGGSMNGAEGVPLNLTGKQMGSPWAQLPSAVAANKAAQHPHGFSGSHHMQASPQTMPLSPPLTPLPPNSARFPPSMVLPPQSPFNPAANLQQLLLAAQCNPFLKTQVPGMPPFPMSPEMMENVQKILLKRQQMLSADLQKSDKESDWVETDDENDAAGNPMKPASIDSSPRSNSNNNNNSNKSTFGERNSSKSDEELKREEEMLEDEMKEEDESSEDEKKQIDLTDSLRAVFMKRFLEDFTNKSGVKPMIPNPSSDMSNPVCQQQDGRPLFHTGEIPCKYNCGKTFSSVLDLFQHQDGNCTKLIMTSAGGDDANDRDNTVITDDDMMSENGDQDSQEDDLNTSGNNSSIGGGERKVRVRTLISDEQLVVLRAFYMVNPRPKREELEKVAAKIGHPFKVVKVWFQNSRARDRREGKGPLVNQPGGGSILGHLSPPSQNTHPTGGHSTGVPPSSSLSMLLNGNNPNSHAFPFLNNNFPQVSNAALLTAAANLFQNSRLPFMNPNSPLFAGSNLEQPFDTSSLKKCNDMGADQHQVSSAEEGEKGGSTIEEGSDDDEFQASRALDSPRPPLHNHLNQHHNRLSSLMGRRNKNIEGDRKNISTSASNTSQQPLDLSNKGLSSSSSSPSNSPLSASMKDTDDKEEKGEDAEEEEDVILNLSSKSCNGASPLTSSSAIKKRSSSHTSSIEDANNSVVMQVEKITTSRPSLLCSQQKEQHPPISSIPSEHQPSQVRPQSTCKSPFPNLSAQGSAAGLTNTTQTSSPSSSLLVGLHAKQSSSLPMDGTYRYGGDEVCFDNDTTVGIKVGGEKFDEEGNYSCEKCNKTFTKRSSLSRHKYEHSGKAIHPY